MAKIHITPGFNGWTQNATTIIRAIESREREKAAVTEAEERIAARDRAELDYYEENSCYPRPLGFFGTETDAHFNER